MVFFLKQSVKNGLDLRMEITTPVMRVFMGKMRIYHQNLGGTPVCAKGDGFLWRKCWGNPA